MYPEAHTVFTHPVGVQKAVISLKIAGTGSYVHWSYSSIATDTNCVEGYKVLL